MRTRQVWIALTVTAATLGGCSSGTGPEFIRTRLEVEGAAASVGEEVTLRVIATNLGIRTVEMNGSCGPPFILEVQDPSGARELLVGGVPSICALYDDHVLEPAETDTIAVRWTAPGSTGRYRLWAWARLPSGLGARSPAVTLEVE